MPIVLSVYTCLIFLTLPIILLRLKWRARKQPEYGVRIAERLGNYSQAQKSATPIDIWLHAVSFGEVEMVKPLVNARLDAGKSIVITTTTPTGSKRVKQLFKESVAHVYLPYELPWAINRFIDFFQPRRLIIAETELWPNILRYTHIRQIPISIINARLSPKSAKHYHYIRPFMTRVLSFVDKILCQTTEDAERFISLGAEPESVVVAGNLKFDAPQSSQTSQLVSKELQHFINGRQIWVAASTHPGEEEQVCQAFNTICQSLPDLLLVLAPRHPERRAEVKKIVEQAGLNAVLRSAKQQVEPAQQVFILDSLGELQVMMQLSQIVFMGGSLVNHGGHNVLEAIRAHCAVLTGPHMHNFSKIYRLLKQAEGMMTVLDSAALAKAVIELMQAPEKRNALIHSGEDLIKQHQGALAKYLELLG